MNIPTKQLVNGFSLPVYGLGLWEMGGRWEADASQDAKEITALQAALEAGITHFDAAESYGHGHAEELIREATKGFDRSKLTIATKVSAQNQTYDGLRASFAASLARLGTDYVDLYMLHRYPEPGIDIVDTLRAVNELVEQGAIKNIGVCNMTPNRFDAVQAQTKHKLVCNQVHYNMVVREAELKGVLNQCQQDDALLVAWGPLQKGNLPNDVPLIEALAEKYNKTPIQIAINWLISQDHVVAISKTSSVEHLHENLGAIGWQMEPTDIEKIRQEYPNQEAVSGRVPLGYEADVAA
jgi:diketogulonate reductase-like aldo/keto reductase